MVVVSPTIALLIPAHNAESFLPRLLRSAHAQREPFDEIWVYDDCSTDNTALVAEGFGARVLRGARPGHRSKPTPLASSQSRSGRATRRKPIGQCKRSASEPVARRAGRFRGSSDGTGRYPTSVQHRPSVRWGRTSSQRAGMREGRAVSNRRRA